jgi:hypothetical protein
MIVQSTGGPWGQQMVRYIRITLLMCLAAGGLAACNWRSPSPFGEFGQYVSDLESIGAAVSSATGYPADHVFVTGSRNDLHISIFDKQLLEADAVTLEKAATAVVAAAEPALARHAEFASIAIIHVGIHHPGGFGRPLQEWHSEDVLEFRRGPDQRFVIRAP